MVRAGIFDLVLGFAVGGCGGWWTGCDGDVGKGVWRREDVGVGGQ